MSFTPIIEYSVIGITCLAMLIAARSDLRTRIVSDTYWMIIMLIGAAGGVAVQKGIYGVQKVLQRRGQLMVADAFVIFGRGVGCHF